jgi:hypothetical protein
MLEEGEAGEVGEVGKWEKTNMYDAHQRLWEVTTPGAGDAGGEALGETGGVGEVKDCEKWEKTNKYDTDQPAQESSELPGKVSLSRPTSSLLFI